MDLISGSTGFVGGRLVKALLAEERQIRLLSRRSIADRDVVVAELADRSALVAACTGVERVFHCAGYAHAFSSLADDDADRHWQVNFEGTRNLVEAAGQAGVKGFVFLSSVKAMAEPGATCADEDFPGDPVDGLRPGQTGGGGGSAGGGPAVRHACGEFASGDGLWRRRAG